MYADFTYSAIASSDITKLISMTKNGLLNISDWLTVNKLSANPQKAEFMAIGYQCRINAISDLFWLKLNNSEINRVVKIKSLGAIVDERLKWKN